MRSKRPELWNILYLKKVVITKLTWKRGGQGPPNAPTFLSIDSCSETPEEQ
jgi:hypothetical protein